MMVQIISSKPLLRCGPRTVIVSDGCRAWKAKLRSTAGGGSRQVPPQEKTDRKMCRTCERESYRVSLRSSHRACPTRKADLALATAEGHLRPLASTCLPSKRTSGRGHLVHLSTWPLVGQGNQIPKPTCFPSAEWTKWPSEPSGPSGQRHLATCFANGPSSQERVGLFNPFLYPIPN